MKFQPKHKLIVLVSAIAFAVASCGNKGSEIKGTGYFKKSDFDTTVAPGKDFFRFVNGGWLKNTEIPKSEARWGSFNEVDELRYKYLRDILQDAAADKDAKDGSNRKKVGDFYASGMDSVKRNSDGITPVKPYLDQIDAIKNTDDLLNVIAGQHRNLGAGPYEISADQDPKNSNLISVVMFQGGLGLPDRDYYFRPDTASKSIRDAYLKYINESLQAIGYEPAKAEVAAHNIMEFETSLAEKSMDRVTLRNPYATYNKMSLKDLQASTPDINWSNQLSAMKFPSVDSVIVGQPEFFKSLSKAIKSYPIDSWKEYLKFHTYSSASPYLDDASFERSFNFYQKKLSGVKQPKPRWKRVLNTIDGSMGEALGEEYVKKAFSEESKERMKNIIENLRTTFRGRIQKLDWMSDSTKAKATTKLDKIVVKVGYPDKWRDYSSLTIDRSSYLANVLRAGEFEFQRQINKIGKPVDRTEWGMNAYTVNAYYNPSNNEIVFPAGILQPPFFGPDLDDACIYGGIGAVICHEMTHGFDDQGSQFDAAGNLRKWWSNEDAAKFGDKTKMVADQFASYWVLDSLHVNGKLTLGENIADLGGVMIALDAFEHTDQFKKGEKIDGYTPEQRFFLNWGRVWRTKYMDAALRQQVLTNPHSPGQFRCNGPITNTEEFYKAFSISDKDAMYVPPAKRSSIW